MEELRTGDNSIAISVVMGVYNIHDKDVLYSAIRSILDQTFTDFEFIIYNDGSDEEVTEYQADKSIEEMADVLEVLFAICEARGYTVEELIKVRECKRENRGGFKDRIYWAGNEE